MSGDATQQLAAASRLVRTGTPSYPADPGNALWLRGIDGKWYEDMAKSSDAQNGDRANEKETGVGGYLDVGRPRGSPCAYPPVRRRNLR